MEKKKALLLLTGGRGAPDMLVVKHLRPNVVLNITTTQGLKDANNLKEFSRSHFHCDIKVLPAVDPFNEQQIRERCLEALSCEPDAEWIMHFTSSPKVVGIYAHDIARERGIPLLFLDTAGEQVIALIKDYKVDTKELFKATVEEYVRAYGRTYEIPKSRAYRKKAESWYEIAQLLAHMPEETLLLLKALRQAESNRNPSVLQIHIQAEQLVQKLSTAGALSISERTLDTLTCLVEDSDMLEFLKGDWLEVYVWQEAMNAGFSDDCQWGYKIVADLPANELDLILTYKARLLIAECKTLSKPFDPDHLYKLHSVADLVGGNYVRQVFVTNTPRPTGRNESFDNFCQQAAIRRTFVITGEQLTDIGSLLKQQISPTGRSK